MHKSFSTNLKCKKYYKQQQKNGNNKNGKTSEIISMENRGDV